MTPDVPVPLGAPTTGPDDVSFRAALPEMDRATRLAVAGELVASVTHDLRQPLTAVEMNIAAAVHLLRRPAPQVEDAIAALLDAREQQERMRDALQVLQDLAVRRAPFVEMIDPVSIVQDVVRLVHPEAMARRVPIGLDIISPIPRVAGNALLIRQALLNVLVDALEATSLSANPHAPVGLVVRPVDGVLEIAVSHLGGRAEGAQDGWGLAVVRSVAEAHRGTAAVEGDSEHGIRVVTRWPLAMPDAPAGGAAVNP